MTTRLLSALLFAGCVLSAPPKQKNPQKFGHLLIQVTGLKTAQSSVARHHVVIVKVKSKNIGTKMALCATFTATLKAEFGLEEPSLPGEMDERSPEISRLLPDEETEGIFRFLLKDGARPLELILVPRDYNEGCRKEGSTGPPIFAPLRLRFVLKEIPVSE
jgi:hypothetical protein